MDVTSVEFYTLAFVVAMALVALLMGRSEKQPPSTYILQLITVPQAVDDADDADDAVTLEPLDQGCCFLLNRSGITLAPDETVNLVITIQQDHCTIIEKKGKKRHRGVVGEPVAGKAVIKCLRPATRYRVRYESQLTSTWATFTLDTSSPTTRVVKLNY